jgi:DNA-binding NtrC family response regulator
MNSSDAQLIKILIVDDEAGVRELLKDALKLAYAKTQALLLKKEQAIKKKEK